jgi:hypothetical protein
MERFPMTHGSGTTVLQPAFNIRFFSFKPVEVCLLNRILHRKIIFPIIIAYF